jgi:putative transferase (TIGR04331 family)
LYINEFDWPSPVDCSGSGNDREMLGKQLASELKAGTPFEAFLASRILRDIPLVHLEGFRALRARVLAIKIRPRAIFTANAHWGNELFKLWGAEQALRGAKYITMGHGGSFPQAFSCMSFEEDIADVKTTWGIPFHKKHVRLPANKLSTVNIKSTQQYLAVLDYDMPRYCFRAEATPKAGQALAHYDMVCLLYASLDKNIQANFSVRPYPDSSWGWNMRKRLVDQLGEDRVSREPDYNKFLSQARVIVCTYPQTTFSEAMASGLPSILCYPAHVWETIPEMDALLDSLRAAKILFTDAKSAAKHINSVWDNPNMWWDSPEAIEARNMFHAQALILNGDCISEWTTFIKKMVA